MEKDKIKALSHANRLYILVSPLYLIIFMEQATAQLYLDLVNLRVSNSPDAGLINCNKDMTGITIIHYLLAAVIPAGF